MPVLLLCQGDPDAKNLLRQAIEARYGINPPAIDSLSIHFKGRSPYKLGPLSKQSAFEAQTYFNFPSHFRWDYRRKLFGFLPVGSGTEAFDAETYRVDKGTVVDSEEAVQSIERRLWAMATLLLMPLSDMYTMLHDDAERTFVADHTKLGVSSKVLLRADGTMETISIQAYNPDTNREQTFQLKLSAEQKPVNDLMLPTQIEAYWDDTLAYSIQPIQVELNPEMKEAIFRLEDSP